MKFSHILALRSTHLCWPWTSGPGWGLPAATSRMATLNFPVCHAPGLVRPGERLLKAAFNCRNSVCSEDNGRRTALRVWGGRLHVRSIGKVRHHRLGAMSEENQYEVSRIHADGTWQSPAVEWSVASRSALGQAERSSGTQSELAWDIRGCFRRRKGLIFGIAALATVLASAVIQLLPSSYEATSAVIFRGDRPDPTREFDVQRDIPPAADALNVALASETELIESDELLTDVVRRLNLLADPEFNPPPFSWPKLAVPERLSATAAPWLDPAFRWGRELMELLRSPDSEHPKLTPAQRELEATVVLMKKRLTVIPVGVSRVIHITYSSDRPEMAALVANTLARLYVDTIIANKVKAASDATDWIQQRLSELRDRAGLRASLDDGRARMGPGWDLAKTQELERNAAADRELFSTLTFRARQLDPKVNYTSPPAAVLSQASVPLRPSSPNKRILLPLSVALSLGLGCIVAVAKENSRRGLYSMDDVRNAVDQTPLGLSPAVRRNDRSLARVFEEGVANVLARVMLPSAGITPRSVVITSALPQEGKSKMSIALAAAATKRGMKVLLVDGDVRSRSVTIAAGLGRSDRTLVQLLSGLITEQDAVHFNDAWGFSVLPAGFVRGSSTSLLANGAWEATLRRLEREYDLILIDTPPVLVGGDAWLVARTSEKTIVLVRWGTTPLRTLELAINQLVTAQASIAGVVLTMVEARKHANYDYGDSAMFSSKVMRYYGRHARITRV